MDRRRFLKNAAGLGGTLLATPLFDAAKNGMQAATVGRVAFVKTTDRTAGVARTIDLLGLRGFGGKDLFVKPNCNSADAPPGSTHNDTLAALVRKLQGMGAGHLTIG